MQLLQTEAGAGAQAGPCGRLGHRFKVVPLRLQRALHTLELFARVKPRPSATVYAL